jgi:hypothetical protein
MRCGHYERQINNAEKVSSHGLLEGINYLDIWLDWKSKNSVKIVLNYMEVNDLGLLRNIKKNKSIY